MVIFSFQNQLEISPEGLGSIFLVNESLIFILSDIWNNLVVLGIFKNIFKIPAEIRQNPQ